MDYPRPPDTQLVLSRLSRQQTLTLITQLTRGKALPAEVLKQLVTKAAGVPLGVEALTRMVLELTDPLSSLALPTMLSDALVARLEQLGTAKHVAQ